MKHLDEIRLEHVDDLALGTAFLGTGGGGDPYLGKLALVNAIETGGPVPLVQPESIDETSCVVSLSGVGAPMISAEKLPNGVEGVHAVRSLERYAGVSVDALIAAEIGGANGLVPMYTAHHLGVPVVDGDGMGRAYPETQMETFSIYGISATPMAAVDEFGDAAVITARDSLAAERILRQVALSMGGNCMCADHLMRGEDVRRFAVQGTVSLAVELGRATREASDVGELVSATEPLLTASGYGVPRVLFEGKVIDVRKDMVGGYDIGEIVAQSFDGKSDAVIRVKNEYLVVEVDGDVRATVPDLIGVFDRETLLPISSERLRYGLRIAVLGIGAPPLYTTPEALLATAPPAFGFDLPYRRLD